MNSKPIIGVMPLWDDNRKSIWIHPGYFDGVIKAGGVPILLPLTREEDVFTQALRICSGLLFTGGQDVSPALYGKADTADTPDTCPLRDHQESLAIRFALEHDLSVLGICRGHQLLNVLLGGTLWQDIPSEVEHPLVHLHTPPQDPVSHDVILEPDTPLSSLLQRQRITVNSYHHQGVRELSPMLKCMARASDGVIEAAYMPEKRFVWGVQWHPEMSCQTDENSMKIFAAFVSSARHD